MSPRTIIIIFKTFGFILCVWYSYKAISSTVPKRHRTMRVWREVLKEVVEEVIEEVVEEVVEELVEEVAVEVVEEVVEEVVGVDVEIGGGLEEWTQ